MRHNCCLVSLRRSRPSQGHVRSALAAVEVTLSPPPLPPCVSLPPQAYSACIRVRTAHGAAGACAPMGGFAGGGGGGGAWRRGPSVGGRGAARQGGERRPPHAAWAGWAPKLQWQAEHRVAHGSLRKAVAAAYRTAQQRLRRQVRRRAPASGASRPAHPGAADRPKRRCSGPSPVRRDATAAPSAKPSTTPPRPPAPRPRCSRRTPSSAISSLRLRRRRRRSRRTARGCDASTIAWRTSLATSRWGGACSARSSGKNALTGFGSAQPWPCASPAFALPTPCPLMLMQLWAGVLLDPVQAGWWGMAARLAYLGGTGGAEDTAGTWLARLGSAPRGRGRFVDFTRTAKEGGQARPVSPPPSPVRPVVACNSMTPRATATVGRISGAAPR